MPNKIIYYNDVLNDDFADMGIKTKTLKQNYKFYSSSNIIYWSLECFLYYIVAFPIIFVMNKVMYLISYKNKKCLRKVKHKGYFIYGNHTNALLDAYNPAIISFPKKAHILVSVDTISIPGISHLVKMLGAIPVPNSYKTTKNFMNAIEKHIKRKRVIAIYPEAHIWPYYTDVRPFVAASCHYPVDLDVPAFAFTSIYKKRLIRKKPKVVNYIDGPFYPDKSLPKKEAIVKLRNELYDAMKKRIDENPKYEYYKYVKKEDQIQA